MSSSTSDDQSPRSYAAFVGCCLIWGSTFLAIRIGNGAMPPLWAATIRLAIAGTLLMIILRLAKIPLPRGAALRSAALFGFLNLGVSFCLLYWSETIVLSGLTAVMYATIPLTSSLLARLFGMEQLSRGKLAGAVVALIGVGLIMSDHLGAGVRWLPTLAGLTAATLGSLSSVMLKRGPRQNPLGTNAVASWVGFGVCGVMSLVTREPHPLPTSWPMLGPILYLASLGSIGAYGLYAWLVNHWPISRLAFIAVVVPVVALFLGAAVGHESLRAGELAGVVLVLAGLAIGIGTDLMRKAPAHA